MAYGNLNVDTVTTSTAGGVLGAGNASIMKNRIINGSMVVSQRNGTSSVTPASADYVIDRFVYFSSQASKFTAQQLSASPPVGFSNYLGLTVASAVSVGAGDYFDIQQPIEGFNTADLGWGTANAKTVTLSFQVYSSLTGTFGGALSNSANSRSYPFTYSIPVANTWTAISVTIAGDTTGTWIGATNGVGLRVVFGLGVGSTYSGTAGAWAATNYISATGAVSVVGTNGATFYITGVQLEVGSSATGFEYVNYQTSLANCQRYLPAFTAISPAPLCSAYTTSSTNVRGTFIFPVTVRSVPTGIVASSAGTFGYSSGSGFTASAVTLNNNGSTNACWIDFAISGASASTGGSIYSASGTATIYFTGCEL